MEVSPECKHDKGGFPTQRGSSPTRKSTLTQVQQRPGMLSLTVTPALTPMCDEANSEVCFPASTVKYPPGQHDDGDDASEKKL